MENALEKILDERSKIPIPTNDVEWVIVLARELALGVHRGIWPLVIGTRTNGRAVYPNDEILGKFGSRRWKLSEWSQTIQRLHGTEFIEAGHNHFAITRAAFDLLHEASPYDIFISYMRAESSALALLVNIALKQHNLVPFVDMALEVGGNWHADLEERIENCDYFIILLGKDTLSSSMTIKEIQWALQYERIIIPLWHSGFDLNADEWADEDEAVKNVIQQTNAIIVQDESASGYNIAIVELLNHFGITP